jgi:hypothetical protein
MKTYGDYYKPYSRLARFEMPYKLLDLVDPSYKDINDFVHRTFYQGNLDFYATRMIRKAAHTPGPNPAFNKMMSSTDMISGVPRKMHVGALTIKIDDNTHSAISNYLHSTSGLNPYIQGVIIRPVVNSSEAGLCPGMKVRTNRLIESITNPLHTTNAIRSVCIRQATALEALARTWNKTSPNLIKCIPIAEPRYAPYINNIDELYGKLQHVLPHIII